MEFGIDLMASLRSQIGSGPDAPASAAFDWAGLHARLSAAHAARQAMVTGDSRPVVFSGGFEDWARVAATSGDNASHGVNPMSSTDGKLLAGIEGVSAGQPDAGGRGQ